MKPHVINFHITNRCNYQCKHCFARFNQRDLSLDEAKRVIDSIEEYFKEAQVKNPRINLAGGEPLMYHYIDEIIDYISNKGIKVSMITNGSLLTEERVEKEGFTRTYKYIYNNKNELSEIKYEYIYDSGFCGGFNFDEDKNYTSGFLGNKDTKTTLTFNSL